MSNFKKVITMLFLVFGFLFFTVGAQAASNILVYDIGANYVAADKFDIIWTTNGSYDCTVIYSTKDGNLDDDSLVATRDADDYIIGSNSPYSIYGTVYYYKLEFTNQGDDAKFFDGNKGYYNIICYDQARNKTTSSVYSIDLIKISNVEINNITTNSAIVEWTSNSPDISYILYGTENSPNGISHVAKDTNVMTQHRLYVQNLATNTKYYFRIQSNSLTSRTIESAVYNFTTANATYSIGLNPSGMDGTITSSPAGINCSVVNGTPGLVSGTCAANFSAGTTVTLTATPASGNVFTSWSTWYNNSGGCTGSSPTCALTMNKDFTIGAIFSSAQTSLPDLTISELSTYQENGKIYLKVKINNSGAATPSGKVIGVKVEDLNTGDIYTSNYSNSLTGSAVLNIQLIAPTSNTYNYELKATIDPTGIINESDETNNISNINSSGQMCSASVTPVFDIIVETTETSATINWNSCVADISSILYGTENSDNGINRVAKDNTSTTNHHLKISNLAPNTKYYYKILSNSLTSNMIESSVYDFTTKVSSDTQISQIITNANLLTNDKMSEILTELNQLRSIVKEQQTQIKYLSSILKDVNGVSADSQAVLNNFITYGVDANTVKLGAGERAAVVNSYKAAFDKLPQTEAELADVIKIANGRWPSITNKDAENQAKAQFLKIYKRAADMNGANDNAAVTIMAYGLRQKAENRNLNSEVNGIKIFKAIYGHTPKTTEEWNAMQAITYSGATQKTWSGYNPNGN